MNEIEFRELPDWTRSMPDHSTFNARDLAEIIGGDKSTIHGKVKRGHLPEPDSQSKCRFNSNAKVVRRNHWSVGALRRFLAEKYNK